MPMELSEEAVHIDNKKNKCSQHILMLMLGHHFCMVVKSSREFDVGAT